MFQSSTANTGSRLLSGLAVLSIIVAATALLFPNPLADVFFTGRILFSLLLTLVGAIGAWTNRTPLVWIAALLLTGLAIVGMCLLGSSSLRPRVLARGGSPLTASRATARRVGSDHCRSADSPGSRPEDPRRCWVRGSRWLARLHWRHRSTAVRCVCDGNTGLRPRQDVLRCRRYHRPRVTRGRVRCLAHLKAALHRPGARRTELTDTVSVDTVTRQNRGNQYGFHRHVWTALPGNYQAVLDLRVDYRSTHGRITHPACPDSPLFPSYLLK